MAGTATATATSQEIRAAKERIAALAAKADQETRERRLAKKKALVGSIDTVATGKGGVHEGLKRFSAKGRTWESSHNNDKEKENNDTSESSPSPSKDLKSIPKTLRNRKQVFENTEKSVPSLFAARSRGAPSPEDSKPNTAASKPLAAAPPTAAEKEAMRKLQPEGWDGKTFYSLLELLQRKTPKTIDAKNREQYLSPEDFLEAFGMTKGAFCCLPKWKRDRLKQSLYLH